MFFQKLRKLIQVSCNRVFWEMYNSLSRKASEGVALSGLERRIQSLYKTLGHSLSCWLVPLQQGRTIALPCEAIQAVLLLLYCFTRLEYIERS